MGKFNVQRSLNYVNTNPIAEETASNKEQTTKRYNKVNPTESERGRMLPVSPRQRRPNSLEGRGWMKKQMLSCNGTDRGQDTSDRKE